MTAIMEHILKNRLSYYLEVNSLLPNNLYGFLGDLGTIDCLAAYIDPIYQPFFGN